jgi:hypothetical protein
MKSHFLYQKTKALKSISIFNSLGMEVKRIEQTEIIRNSKITISVADLLLVYIIVPL